MSSDDVRDLEKTIVLSLEVTNREESELAKAINLSTQTAQVDGKAVEVIDVDAFNERITNGKSPDAPALPPSKLSFIEQRKLDEAARLERLRKRGVVERVEDEVEFVERRMKKARVEPVEPVVATLSIPAPVVSLKAKRQRDTSKASEMRFAGGAIRITRTPGRRTEKFCISLDELIDGASLKTAFVHSFFIQQDELFQYFPFKPFGKYRPECTVIVGRDLFMDDEGLAAASMNRESKLKATQMSDYDWAKACSQAAKFYKRQYGDNFKAVYTRMTSVGCAHSKVLVLVYEPFLRIVITSANMMSGDVEFADNHFYIHDLPLLEKPKAKRLAFEKQLFSHLADLACPIDFLEGLRGKYDFSSIKNKAYLVVSTPGAHKGSDAEKYGSLRLRALVRGILEEDGIEDADMEFEVCTGSVGRLESTGKDGNPGFLKGFLESCAGGKQTINEFAPPVKIVYPTKQTVAASTMGELSATNIGSHVQWPEAPLHIKKLFYDYRSKDPGMLFHQKLIIGHMKGAPADDPPVYVYIGSANISAGAWGVVAKDKRSKENGALRLADTKNYECGVIVRGKDLVGLLGGDRWDDIVPYVTPLRPYDLGRAVGGDGAGLTADKPWNSASWVN